ncbi:unnamed protein product [Eruca vesicaria subsp. sativa]|uniref:Uncharacterized protein n=1 Tax=Eruca vesicaria subsp. sativa TaxID=29727 RepID=A0ABC8LU15_ERUVS|nr:unnamed protein product [Eruca vesicaria subsp. sativa]
MEEVEREVIKSATPSTNDCLQLSLLDLMNSPANVPVIFFYETDDEDIAPEIISAKLKSSLSQTLSRFYPLAGRREGITISCNDEGAVFTEARTDLLLCDLMKDVNSNSLERFYPTMALVDSPTEWPLLRVKWRSQSLSLIASATQPHC